MGKRGVENLIICNNTPTVTLRNRLKSFLYIAINDDIKFVEFINLDIIQEFIKRHNDWNLNRIVGEEPILGFKEFKRGEINGLLILRVKDRKMESFIKNIYGVLKKHIVQYNKNNNTNIVSPTLKEMRENGLVDKLTKSIIKNLKYSDKLPSFLLIHKHMPYSIDNIFPGTMTERNQYLINLSDKYCGFGNHMVNKKIL
jgi:hypothetical protein